MSLYKKAVIIKKEDHMKRLIQDAEGVYMIDEECMKKKEEIERRKEMSWQYKKREMSDADAHQKNLRRRS